MMGPQTRSKIKTHSCSLEQFHLWRETFIMSTGTEQIKRVYDFVASQFEETSQESYLEIIYLLNLPP